MAFPDKIPLTREDGCVMDSGLKDLPSGAPSTTPSSSWVPKELTNSSFTGTGFSDTSGRLVFLPVQPVADTTATASVNCFFYYEGTFSGTIGGMGQTEHTVVLNDIAPSDSYVNLTGVTINCGVDNEGFSLAQITAEYMYNTLANLMFTNGNSAELTDGGIITVKWSPEVVQFNS